MFLSLTENSRSPSIQSSTSSLSGGHGMPKEVFIVDIKKAKNGLGVGFVDGIVTSLGVPGIYVRSLVPDGPGIKVYLLFLFVRKSHTWKMYIYQSFFIAPNLSFSNIST